MSTQFPHERILMGPGSSPVPHRVPRALAAPTPGQPLDLSGPAIMDATCGMLGRVMRARSELTVPVSGIGTADSATTLVHPGDAVIVCVNGVLGGRMEDAMEDDEDALVPLTLRVAAWVASHARTFHLMGCASVALGAVGDAGARQHFEAWMRWMVPCHDARRVPIADGVCQEPRWLLAWIPGLGLVEASAICGTGAGSDALGLDGGRAGR